LIGGAILTGALLLLVLPGRLFPLSTLSLPGFRVDLPLAPRERRGAGNYRNGKVTAKAPLGRMVVQISWEPGEVFNDAEMTALAKAVGGAFGRGPIESRTDLELPVPTGLKARSAKLVLTGQTPFWLTVVGCGARRMSLMTTGRAAGLEALHRRMLASFECRPDGREAGVTDIPVVMELHESWPDGWRRVGSSSEQLVVTDGTSAILARTLTGDVRPEMIDKVLSALLGGMVHVGAREGTDWPIDGTMGGKSVLGWVALRSCPEYESSLLVLATHPSQGELAHSWLSKVRCRRKDEAPQTWSVPAVLPPGFRPLREPKLDLRRPKLRLLGKP
jgi:hypothetical protein